MVAFTDLPLNQIKIMKDIKLVELFSGTGGFTKGFENAGFNISEHYYSEIDKHAIANYKYNYPNAKHIGSVTDVQPEDIGRPDIITFGSPCQDFSLAGEKRGLEGQRSVLILEAIRLLRECKPSLFIWENVKGTFSSNSGADFWAILNAFTNIGGYRLEWQLLNTNWVLPQNRERIYLVGHLAGRSIGQIFPFTENDQISDRKNEPRKGRPPTKHSTTLKASGAMKADDTFVAEPVNARCLTSKDSHVERTVIAVATPDRKKKNQNGRRFKNPDEPSFTLTCNDPHGVMLGENYMKWRESQTDRAFYEDGSMGTLMADGGGNKSKILTKEYRIRRLTEIECERLQGFPDDWTKYGNYDGVVREISKTQRYKLCGNAVTVKIVEAIAKRIKLKSHS